jgi:hypothetical protein
LNEIRSFFVLVKRRFPARSVFATAVRFTKGPTMDIHRVELFNLALLRSLNTIQSAKTQFYGLTAHPSTPTALASRIKLCDVLLAEIHAISCRLETRMRHDDMKHRRSGIGRHDQVATHLSRPESGPATHAKQKL